MEYLKFEFKRIFKDRKNVLILLFILVLSIYHTSMGISQYNSFLEEKESFKQFEKKKVTTFINYFQYSAYGFRILYEISPISVFFMNSALFEAVESNVDVTDKININHSSKGKNLFSSKGNYKDFSGTLFLFGSLFMLYMGAGAFKSKTYFLFLSRRFGPSKTFWYSTAARLFLLDAILVLIILSVYLFVFFHGIPLMLSPLFLFSIFALLYFNFFYCCGLATRILTGFKLSTYLLIFLFWIVSLFLLPELSQSFLQQRSQNLPSNDQFNLEKLKTLMEFEDEVYTTLSKKGITGKEWKDKQKELVAKYHKEGFMLNTERELDLKHKMELIVSDFENTSMLYPSLYFRFLSSELSSNGYKGYMEYLEHLIYMRQGFMKFFLDHYHEMGKGKVKNFITAEENFFKARSFVPATFWIGAGITFLYILLILWAAYFQAKRVILKP